MDDFAELLLRWQAKTNLVAPSTLAHLWTRHLEEGLLVFDLVPAGSERIVDLGSGGGLPGIVIAIGLKERGAGAVSLVESNGKKAAFLRTVVRELDLPADVHATRIESETALIATADVFTARALAPLESLFDMVGDQLRPEAVCLFPKGENHADEIAAASARWHFDMVKQMSPDRSGSAILAIRHLRRRI